MRTHRDAGASRDVQGRRRLVEQRRAPDPRPLPIPVEVGLAVEQQPGRFLRMHLLEGFGTTESVDPEIDAGIETGLALPGDLGVSQGKAAAEAGDQVLAGHTLVRE